jgi:hypothetical protein
MLGVTFALFAVNVAVDYEQWSVCEYPKGQARG